MSLESKTLSLRVYVAGPYTKGDLIGNIRSAIKAGESILASGHTPFIPHLNHAWDMLCPHSSSVWSMWDMEWLKLCDLIIRLPGKSRGADHEVKFAQEHGIPVLTLEEFLEKADASRYRPVEAPTGPAVSHSPDNLHGNNMTIESRLRTLYPSGHPDFIRITLEEIELYAKKSEDYAEGGDPFGNFRRTEVIKRLYPGMDWTSDYGSAIIYMLKQLDAVLWNLAQGKETECESLDDKLRDISVYIKLIRIMLRSPR